MLPKVMFVVANELEAKLVKFLSDEMVGCETVNIGTGKYCCEQGSKLPELAMCELDMSYKGLPWYGTKNVVRIIRSENPDAIVVGSDQDYLRRAFAQAGNDLGIPTVLFQLGISSNVANKSSIVVKRTLHRVRCNAGNIFTKYLYLFRTVAGLGWNPYRIMRMVLGDTRVAFTIDDDRGRYAQHILVAGNWEKKILEERGIDNRKITLVGRPSVGVYSGAFKEFGVVDGQKVVLFLTTAMAEHGWWSAERRRALVVGAVEELLLLRSEKVKLVIKIHPMENLEVYQKMLEGRDIILCRDVSLEDVVNVSDVVVVGGFSTTVLEASELGKPVVMLNVYNEVESIPYAEMGLALEVRNLKLLSGIVTQLLVGGKAREELLDKSKAFFGSNEEFTDGKATNRIAETIMGIAKEHKERA